MGLVERRGLWSEEQRRAAAEIDLRIERDHLDVVRFLSADQHGLLRGKTVVAAERARGHAHGGNGHLLGQPDERGPQRSGQGRDHLARRFLAAALDVGEVLRRYPGPACRLGERLLLFLTEGPEPPTEHLPPQWFLGRGFLGRRFLGTGFLGTGFLGTGFLRGRLRGDGSGGASRRSG